MGLLNVEKFYDPLLGLFDHAVKEGFLRQQNRDMVLAETDIERLLEVMTHYRPEAVSKWLKETKQL
jgi:predicted Rossmann-fold nucleotide-binding protein